MKNIKLSPLSVLAETSVVIVLDADPDPNFYVSAYSDRDSDWYQNYAEPHADPTQVSHMLEPFFLFLRQL